MDLLLGNLPGGSRFHNWLRQNTIVVWRRTKQNQQVTLTSQTGRFFPLRAGSLISRLNYFQSPKRSHPAFHLAHLQALRSTAVP